MTTTIVKCFTVECTQWLITQILRVKCGELLGNNALESMIVVWPPTPQLVVPDACPCVCDCAQSYIKLASSCAAKSRVFARRECWSWFVYILSIGRHTACRQSLHRWLLTRLRVQGKSGMSYRVASSPKTDSLCRTFSELHYSVGPKWWALELCYELMR